MAICETLALSQMIRAQRTWAQLDYVAAGRRLPAIRAKECSARKIAEQTEKACSNLSSLSEGQDQMTTQFFPTNLML